MLGLFKENKMFRVFAMYQVFSSLGGGVFSLFMLLSVHLIYHNPVYTGIVGFLVAAPHIFSFAVGPIVDRSNKALIMRVTTFLEFLVLALLTFMPFQEQISVVFMFAVVFIYSIAALFEGPSGTALLPQIIPEEKIMEANSLVQIATLISGIIIAAVLFASLGRDVDFRYIYGLSTVFLALAFVFSMFLKGSAIKPTLENKNYLRDLKEGVQFIRGNILLYTTLAVVAMALFTEIVSVNRPMFFEYHVGAQGYIIFAVMGMIGGIGASVFIGAIGKKFRLGQLIFALLVFAGCARIVFVFILPSSYIGGLVIMIVYAALSSAVGIIFSSLVQKLPPKDMVGRVDTISTTFAAVAVTVGALIGGFLGSTVPIVDHIFISQGVGYIVIGLLMILIPTVRRLPKINDIKDIVP